MVLSSLKGKKRGMARFIGYEPKAVNVYTFIIA
jgi:hypothetical protein